MEFFQGRDIYTVKINGDLEVTGHTTLNAVEYITAFASNLECDSLTVNNAAFITGTTIEEGVSHGEDVLSFDRPLSANTFAVVTGSDAGFYFGEDQDESTGDYNYLVDSNATDIILASSINGVVTSLQDWDRTNGDTIHPHNVAIQGSLAVNTIGANSGTKVTTTGNFEIDGIGLMGTSITPATSIAGGVFQIKGVSDASYGNPTSSALLYVDSDNAVKTKNTAGNIVNLSSIPSYASFYRLGNGTDTVITTADTWTRSSTSMNTNVTSGFSIATSTITYTGAPSVNLRVTLSGSILSVANNLLFGLSCAKNGTFNGSNELTSSIINGSAMETSVPTAGQQGALSSSFIISAATNDTFTILVKNSTTDDVNLRTCAISISAFTAGTD